MNQSEVQRCFQWEPPPLHVPSRQSKTNANVRNDTPQVENAIDSKKKRNMKATNRHQSADHAARIHLKRKNDEVCLAAECILYLQQHRRSPECWPKTEKAFRRLIRKGFGRLVRENPGLAVIKGQDPVKEVLYDDLKRMGRMVNFEWNVSRSLAVAEAYQRSSSSHNSSVTGDHGTKRELPDSFTTSSEDGGTTRSNKRFRLPSSAEHRPGSPQRRDSSYIAAECILYLQLHFANVDHWPTTVKEFSKLIRTSEKAPSCGFGEWVNLVRGLGVSGRRKFVKKKLRKVLRSMGCMVGQKWNVDRSMEVVAAYKRRHSSSGFPKETTSTRSRSRTRPASFAHASMGRGMERTLPAWRTKSNGLGSHNDSHSSSKNDPRCSQLASSSPSLDGDYEQNLGPSDVSTSKHRQHLVRTDSMGRGMDRTLPAWLTKSNGLSSQTDSHSSSNNDPRCSQLASASPSPDGNYAKNRWNVSTSKHHQRLDRIDRTSSHLLPESTVRVQEVQRTPSTKAAPGAPSDLACENRHSPPSSGFSSVKPEGKLTTLDDDLVSTTGTYYVHDRAFSSICWPE